MRVFATSCLIFLFIFPNISLAQETGNNRFAASGTVEGYVFNYYGIIVSDAVVGIENGPYTFSGPDGYYILEEVGASEQNLGCGKSGYNPSWIIVNVLAGDTTYQDFSLTQPEMVINPLLINEVINPGEYLTSTINILNTGSGTLGWQAEVNYISMPQITCDYSIALYDTWGDGWTGSSLDVLVNDSVVLDNITLSSGFGPAVFYFPVLDGDQITTQFYPGAFVTEPYYYVYNTSGEQVWFSPAANSGPPDILPGQLSAECNAGQWLTLSSYNGEVPPFGGLSNVPAYLNASGTLTGDTYEANITFTSMPNVGEITIPVVMTIQGNAIISPKDLSVSLISDTEGMAELSWEWDGDTFQFFLIKRDGQIIATTNSQTFTDFLPDFGTYCYTVQSVYTEGLSEPAGPVCLEWPDPVVVVEPDSLQGWVWTGYTVDVFTTISNQGEGSLAFSFPEFTALRLLNDPKIKKNLNGAPGDLQHFYPDKGDEGYNGAGYPVLLGAGGPDDFGYVWIDSDEDGGPAFNYTDISTTGTPVYGISDDNIVGPFEIGFEFYFYGEVKEEFWINSNGCIGFSSNYITIGNTTIPTNSSVYNDFIAWMWDDLVFKPGTSQAFYEIISDKLIIQFKNYEYYNLPGLYINAEIVIYENGKILLLYDNFDPGITLNSCTVGIQSPDPDMGLQVVFNSNYLHNDLAILISIPADFITKVEPSFGTVPEGGSENITITYDSRDYAPGPYSQELLLFSNDHANRELIIANTMNVFLPGIFSGVVTDRDNEEPLNGVQVTAGPFQSSTGENGEFVLYVDEGIYDVEFTKLGYRAVTIKDTTAIQGEIAPLSIGLWDMNYAPGFVLAQVMDDDTLCEITWGLPQGPYEIIMDDGQADDFFVFAHAGSWHAVKFTPTGYPATIIGGQFYVGDGSFPGPFLGTDFGVAVFDDDGVNGLPGTMLDSTGVSVNNSGWVSLEWLNAEISNGSFYLAMYQSGNSPHAAPIGYDTDNPTYFRSYTKFLGNDWILSPLQDFMIRAWVNGPERTARDVVDYQVVRYADFDPYGPPSAGTITGLTTSSGLVYHDSAWASLPEGWYAYGVRAHYTSGLYSEYITSNIVTHLMDFQLAINVILSDGEDPNELHIRIDGPFTDIDTVINNGNIVFDLVWDGYYNVSIFKIGYEEYRIENSYFNNDKVFNIVLSEKKYAPDCLTVDPVSLMASWCYPLITVLKEDFESTQFPPPGWQSSPGENGWYKTINGSSDSWIIPPWDSQYACSIGDAGTDQAGCCDYLITPPLDLRESEKFTLCFDSFYDGLYGHLAFVEYSHDAGQTWQTLWQMIPDSNWSNIELTLDTLCGHNCISPVWFAFRSDCDGNIGAGWSIDNICVAVPDPYAGYLDFWVFLDDAYIGSTQELTWDLSPLPYGQTYTVSVAARYSSGLSPKMYCTFNSKYLFPPQNLIGSAPDDAAILTWNPPGTSLPINLLGYNIYRDDVFTVYLEHMGLWEMQGFVEENMLPGKYDYAITGTYDLTPYGFPGETGESMKEGPAEVVVDYCNELEFVESWDLGNFGNNQWLIDGPNWSVNNQSGNPPPVAKFSWNPLQTDYAISLESYPLCAYGLTEGNIYLDFDLSLYSMNATGNEWMRVQVWDWESKDWATAGEFDNEAGNFEWTSSRINITAQAMNKIFKIRFMAGGNNTIDIRGWFLDNIRVYRVCTAPDQLVTDPFNEGGIRLTWQLADPNINEDDAGSRVLTGCKVYRSIDGAAYELLPGLVAGNEYVDPGDGLAFGSLYCYKVSAVWESQTDQCESDFSNEACVIFTGVNPDQPQADELTNLYPNPADNYVILSSFYKISHVAILDNLGRIIYEEITPGVNSLQIQTSHLARGIYLVRVTSNHGIISIPLSVAR